MTRAKAIVGSIKHYDRMIKWAEKLPLKRKVNGNVMLKKLGEKWYDTHCSLCIKYRLTTDLPCGACPLCKRFGNCPNGYKNVWKLLPQSKTWGEWVINAKKMRRQLKSLRRKKK